MDRDALKRELTEQFHQSMDQAIEAVEQAPDGSWIAASEWQVRELFQKLTAQALERILQAKLDAHAGVGADRIAAASGEADAVRLPVRVGRGLPGNGKHRRTAGAESEHADRQRLLRSTVQGDRARYACGADLGSGRIPHVRGIESAGECDAAEPSAAITGTEPCGEPVALSAEPLLVQPQLRQL